MGRDGYNVKAALVGMMSGVISTDVNTAQFTDVLLGCALSGYLAPAKDGWNDKTIANYNAGEDWYRVFMASDRIIPVIYTNYKQLKNSTDDPNILAVGDIVKVAAMHRVTDTYGPIPYSQIGSNGEISVPYDSQEDVYRTMLTELSDAINTLK
ncbi:MAG: SusD/RagB family nutrient-binding outer membrane lipoprotein, partial [Bacteroidetes bacterium]|nr:SusD/RagB family nutrient-binding outer membrane lipoprotein [Candidatus Cryptobacteroides faecigallinarum]